MINDDAIKEYLLYIKFFDSNILIEYAIESVSYGGILYMYGSESLQNKIVELEKVLFQQFNIYVNSQILFDKRPQAFLYHAQNFIKELKEVVEDPLRLLCLSDWLNHTNQGMIDYKLPYEVKKRIETERRAYSFFYDCLSFQIYSAKRMINLIQEYILQIENLILTKDNNINVNDLVFTVRSQFSYNLYLDLTTSMHRSLIKEQLIDRTMRLTSFRSLFQNSYKAENKLENLDVIIWNNTSYNSLSYFIKLLQDWFIEKPLLGSKKSNYKIAIRRFVNTKGEVFETNKARHNLDPSKNDMLRVHQVFIDAIEENKNSKLPNTDLTLSAYIPDHLRKKIRLF